MPPGSLGGQRCAVQDFYSVAGSGVGLLVVFSAPFGAARHEIVEKVGRGRASSGHSARSAASSPALENAPGDGVQAAPGQKP